MTTIPDYMDAARRHAGLKSDRQLCVALGLTAGGTSMWRRGYTLPNAAHMVRLAELAGMDPDRALLDLAIADSERQGWTDIAARYRAMVARIAVGFFAPVLIYTAVPFASSEGGGTSIERRPVEYSGLSIMRI